MCFIKPSRRSVSKEELLNLVNLCGLNHIITYGTHLASHIQFAKKDPAILKLLQGMKTILYSGVGISYADDDWCFQNGIPLIVSILYCTSRRRIVLTNIIIVPLWHNRMWYVFSHTSHLLCSINSTPRSSHGIRSRKTFPVYPPTFVRQIIQV
jgi:hypothetical protein